MVVLDYTSRLTILPIEGRSLGFILQVCKKSAKISVFAQQSC